MFWLLQANDARCANLSFTIDVMVTKYCKTWLHLFNNFSYFWPSKIFSIFFHANSDGCFVGEKDINASQRFHCFDIVFSIIFEWPFALAKKTVRIHTRKSCA